MIQAVIIDCFGVLYRDPSLDFYEQHVPNYSEIRQDLLDNDTRFDRGFITNEQHSAYVADLTGLDLQFVLDNIRGEHVRNDSLLEFSQSLRPTYRLGMLSNIGRGGMEPFFSTSQQSDLFDAVVLSNEVGVSKPDVRIYEIIAERLGVDTAVCVMVDDRAENIDGAVAAGMQGVLYQTNEQAIRDLAQLEVYPK